MALGSVCSLWHTHSYIVTQRETRHDLFIQRNFSGRMLRDPLTPDLFSLCVLFPLVLFCWGIFFCLLILLHLASSLRVFGTWVGLNMAFVFVELHCEQPGGDDHWAFRCFITANCSAICPLILRSLLCWRQCPIISPIHFPVEKVDDMWLVQGHRLSWESACLVPRKLGSEYNNCEAELGKVGDTGAGWGLQPFEEILTFYMEGVKRLSGLRSQGGGIVLPGRTYKLRWLLHGSMHREIILRLVLSGFLDCFRWSTSQWVHIRRVFF